MLKIIPFCVSVQPQKYTNADTDIDRDIFLSIYGYIDISGENYLQNVLLDDFREEAKMYSRGFFQKDSC